MSSKRYGTRWEQVEWSVQRVCLRASEHRHGRLYQTIGHLIIRNIYILEDHYVVTRDYYLNTEFNHGLKLHTINETNNISKCTKRFVNEGKNGYRRPQIQPKRRVPQRVIDYTIL
jgi:hypothetical protein